MIPANSEPEGSSSDEPSRPGALRVVVVADDPLARNGLAFLLAGADDLVVVARRDTGQDPAPDEADVAVWDLGADAALGLERFQSHAAADLRAAVLMDDGDRVEAALLAGARAVLPRGADGDRVAAALRAVAADLIVVDPDYVGTAFRPPAPPPPPVDALTPRELQVLQLLAEGLANKVIADRLGISDHTAKFHVNSILGKLDAESRTDAVVKAARLGLIAI